ncbi:MAG: hypothetical protein ACK55Z_10825, partial [bacterium]
MDNPAKVVSIDYRTSKNRINQLKAYPSNEMTSLLFNGSQEPESALQPLFLNDASSIWSIQVTETDYHIRKLNYIKADGQIVGMIQ